MPRVAKDLHFKGGFFLGRSVGTEGGQVASPGQHPGLESPYISSPPVPSLLLSGECLQQLSGRVDGGKEEEERRGQGEESGGGGWGRVIACLSVLSVLKGGSVRVWWWVELCH